MESAEKLIESHWTDLQARVGFPICERERTFYMRMHSKPLARSDPMTTERVFRSIEEAISVMRALGGSFHEWPSVPGRTQTKKIERFLRANDARWRLWGELIAQVRTAGGGSVTEVWQSLSLTRVFDMSAAPLGSQRVEISFDSRYSLKALKDLLSELWPTLREQGWVQGRRPIQERKLQVVRFVCMETEPDWTWRKRFDEWNNHHPDRRYKSRQAFLSDFRKAEESLTGRKYGLAWFYDEEAKSFEYEQYVRMGAATQFRWLRADGNSTRSQIRYACVDPYEHVESELAALKAAQDFYDRLSEAQLHAYDELVPELGDTESDADANAAELSFEAIDQARAEGVELDATYVRGTNQMGHAAIWSIRPDPDQLGDWRVDR